MSRYLSIARSLGLLGLALMFAFAPAARAERVPSSKAAPQVTSGPRGDITVPYLSNGRSTLGVSNGVAPVVVGSPELTNPVVPQVMPSYNLIFYGSSKGFSSYSTGAAQRQQNQLRR
jgi:hypothetical protein